MAISVSENRDALNMEVSKRSDPDSLEMSNKAAPMIVISKSSGISDDYQSIFSSSDGHIQTSPVVQKSQISIVIRSDS